MPDRQPPWTERAYRWLLRLLPTEFRRRFGADLADAFRDGQRAARTRGPFSVAMFWSRNVGDLIASAIGERWPRHGRALRQGVFMERLLQDVRYAWRTIARRPTASLIIVATLALGIGANTAIFSLMHTVLLRPLPYADADRLFRVWEHQPARGDSPVRPANFFDWKASAQSFADVAWSRDTMYNLTGDGPPEAVIGYRFSANMLSVLGVRPAIGRDFRADEDRPGGDRVALLSHGLWQRRYAGDPAILGRSITMNGESYHVIGVMPASFKHPQGVEVWTPVQLTPAIAARRDVPLLRLVARLKQDVKQEDAQTELAAIYAGIVREHPDVGAGMAVRLAQLGDVGDAKPMLAVLASAVGFVLLIACANVANLLLVDATARRRELAVRGALGASRARVVRQMLTESVVLAVAGGLVGSLAVWWTRDALVALFPRNISNLDLPLVDRVDMGVPVFLFAAAVSLVTGLVFGGLPAWNAARANALRDGLKDGDRGVSAARRTHGVLVIVEVALSTVLLAGALLMTQSFVRLQQRELGFDADRVLTARLVLPRYKYGDPDAVRNFTRALHERLQAIPGVESAGITNYLPLSGWWGDVAFYVEGQPEPPPGDSPTADYRLATEDYFRTMGIRMLHGRPFTARDVTSAPRVVIVNETLARTHWPGQNPVGRRILLDSQSGRVPVEVVGLIADVRSFGMEEAPHAELFLPFWQESSPLLGMTLRTQGDPGSLSTALRDAVWSVDRAQPITHLLPMAQLAHESLAFRRVGMLLAAGFSLLALGLAAIGIYGVLSYAVTQRSREIGIRMALGATGRGVASLVVRHALLLTGVGIAIGVMASAALTQFLKSVLVDVRVNDPRVYIAVGITLAVVALLAAWLPARRATGVDPIVALRAD